MLGGNMNTVPQIEYDDEKDINILKGQLLEIKKMLTSNNKKSASFAVF